CEAAAALALWVEQDVQPLAVSMFGSRVTWIEDMGTYSCRNMIGNKRWVNMRSQHSLANAVDIGGFRLENGKQISIRSDYKGSGPEARFLREAHMRACRYFRVAIGPEPNEARRENGHANDKRRSVQGARIAHRRPVVRYRLGSLNVIFAVFRLRQRE